MAERIKQRRTQMFLHSFLYYGLDKPTVSDGDFDRWARELVELQKIQHFIGFYDVQFYGWDGCTGCHLKPPQWIIRKAYYDRHQETIRRMG